MKKENEIRAVVYARYSSHSQTEQSIEGQISAAQVYAKAKGYTIVKEYVDRAKTGKNDNREAFQQMLSDTAKHEFSVIIVWKVDRFGRNREEITFNKYRCKKNDVRVEYIAEAVPDSPEGVILESVLEGMAEYYSLQLAQNIRRGIRASAEKCQAIGGHCSLGYAIDPKTKKYVIDPDTAPTVQLIFDKYAEGYTGMDIVRLLNEKGLRTVRGKPFTKNSLWTILKNERYAGVYLFKDEVRVEGGIPALVSRETFDKVQEMLEINHRSPVNTWNRATYLLTDKLFCGHCGSKMVGECGTSRTGATYNYYICAGKKRERNCSKKAVRQDWIEKVVLQQIRRVLFDQEFLEFIAHKAYTYYLEEKKKLDQSAAIKAQLSSVESSIDNLIRAMEAGIFSASTKSRLDDLENQKAALTRTLAEIKLSEESFDLTEDRILFFLESMRGLDMDDVDSRKRLVKTFVNAVYLYDDKITLAFNFTDSCEKPEIIELADIADGVVEKFVHRASCSTKKALYFVGSMVLFFLLKPIWGGLHCFACTVFRLLQAVELRPRDSARCNKREASSSGYSTDGNASLFVFERSYS